MRGVSIKQLEEDAKKLRETVSSRYEEYIAAVGAYNVLLGLVEKYNKPLLEEEGDDEAGA